MELSIIVPAFNEEKRIGPFLKSLSLLSRKLRDFEIIFVNDGSTDGTLAILNKFCRMDKHVRVISYMPNKGKGFAVRRGVLASKGRKIIFIDADGSIDPKNLLEMSKNLDSYEIVIGSRTHPSSKISQTPVRKVTSLLFNLSTGLMFGIGTGDKLCGFKGFRREAGLGLFKNLASTRWVFDIELLYLAKKKGYTLFQQPLEWVHKKDSKMKISDPLKIGMNLLSLRWELSKRK